MKSFFKTTLAAALGVILASILCGILGIWMLSALISSTSQEVVLEENSILKVPLNGSVVEYGNGDDTFGGLAGIVNGDEEETLGLNEIRQAIKRAAKDDNIKGIYLKTGILQGGPASFEEIRQALLEFKQSGKFIYAYIEQVCEQGAYYISSVADTIMMNPQGSVGFYGMSATPVFYTDVLKKFGVKPQVFKVGTYKSAVEPYINTKMSDANREQTLSYMNSIWNNMLGDISASRGLSKEELNRIADDFLILKEASCAVECGLIDSLCYVPDMKDFLASKVGVASKDLKLVSVRNLNSITETDIKYQPDKIAVMYAAGQIYDKSSGIRGGGAEEIVYNPVIKELKELQEDKSIKAVVLRVNSPGGSAFASEQICQVVKELKKVKPVVVSMGTYAASGGYYISSNADSIIASPTTLTGSIGIFGLNFNASELFQKIGLHYDMVKTNRYSDFGNFMREMTPGEKALMQQNIERGYELFTSRCAEGRHMDVKDIKKVAEGRVWTGEQALALGLVDKLGYLDDAIEMAAAMAKVEDYAVVSYPKQKDTLTALLESLSGETEDLLLSSKPGIKLSKFVKELERGTGTMALMPYTLDIN